MDIKYSFINQEGIITIAAEFSNGILTYLHCDNLYVLAHTKQRNSHGFACVHVKIKLFKFETE